MMTQGNKRAAVRIFNVCHRAHKRRRPHWLLVLSVLILLVGLGGCASLKEPLSAGIGGIERLEADSETGWWFARFRYHWPQDARPKLYLDTLVAHRIVMPALMHFEDRIELWRFHRRSARDSRGHQFSFIFYSDSDTAQGVFLMMNENPDLKKMISSGEIEAVVVDSPNHPLRSGVADTSDKNWSVNLQRCWPYYIMGVSRLWLELINEMAVPEGPDPDDDFATIAEMEAFYKLINDRITLVWRIEGQHAFLHHMDALFGYEPLLLDDLRERRF